MTADVPDLREDIDYSQHIGSCRVFYAERRCTCVRRLPAVPDPRFRDQLASVALTHWRTSTSGCACGQIQLGESWTEHLADALLPVIAAEVEARVQTAAAQRAAEELRALACEALDAVPGAQRVTIPVADLFDRAAALAQPSDGGGAR